MPKLTKTITRKSDGATFEAHVFSRHSDALAYATSHPVLMRNASGSMLRHSAPIHKLSNGSYAVI